MEKEHVRNCWCSKVFLSVCLQQEIKKCTMGEDVLINSGSKLSAINQILCLQKENIKAVQKSVPLHTCLLKIARRNLKVCPGIFAWPWELVLKCLGSTAGAREVKFGTPERKLMRLLTWVGTDCCNLSLVLLGLRAQKTHEHSRLKVGQCCLNHEMQNEI